MGILDDRLTQSDPAAASHVQVGLEAFGREYPVLWEYMTVEKLESGMERQTCSLAVFCDMGRVKVAINDRDRHMVAFVTGSGLLDALDVLEDALKADTLDWRPSGGGGRRRK